MPWARSRSFTCGLWMISPVRKTRSVGKPLARLVGVVDGAIDAVAEAEFLREVNRQPAGCRTKPAAWTSSTIAAVVRRGQIAGDGLFQVEALAEEIRGHGPDYSTAGRTTAPGPSGGLRHRRGVRSSIEPRRDLTGRARSPCRSNDSSARKPPTSRSGNRRCGRCRCRASAAGTTTAGVGVTEPRADLAADDADDQAGGGSDAHPGGRHAAVRPVSFGHAVWPGRR